MQKPPTVGLEAKHLPEPASRRLRRSGIYRNPALTEGQKLYLLQKCHVIIVEEKNIFSFSHRFFSIHFRFMIFKMPKFDIKIPIYKY